MRNEELRFIIVSYEAMIAEIDAHIDEESNNDDGIEFEAVSFEDLLLPLQAWLQSQASLEIHGATCKNRKTLELGRSGHQGLSQYSIEYLARTVGYLYIENILQPVSTLRQAETISGSLGHVIHRKCARCDKPVLDDALPSFFAEFPDHYVLEIARGSRKK
ncbi:hypothetical protein N7457_009301 [Penicillium paradoxum]|uniref:uncharacterized protein n=1 Tax=Penicillium paradoxum TaxID=176176 RepID=UPI00254969E6|nr:uncharacterized protein N7457_009301 [Penicillium paradoxum]KAJ5774405.1 hypothetical protein N7457_009301 [Penicillium paradoxum]